MHDDVDARIAGHGGGAYTSPPQRRADALALIGLLLGGAADHDGAARVDARGARRAAHDHAERVRHPHPARQQPGSRGTAAAEATPARGLRVRNPYLTGRQPRKYPMRDPETFLSAASADSARVRRRA